MGKNIVVFSDGTGQDGGTRYDTNVYKLFCMVEDRTDRQVTFYDRGLGTGLRRLSGQITGAGISKNIKDCYQFIFEEFKAGDSIYLFGFSRGATTVRSLSSFIHLFGILPKSRPELIEQAYRIYKIGRNEKRDRKAAEFVRRHHNMWTRVRFIGAWDTVAALGIPIKTIDVVLGRLPFLRHRFQDLRLSKSVEHARHALAIDDERKIFQPVPWDTSLEDYQTLQQVWFCGSHTDVGGGYPEQALADLALIWMRDEAVRQGLRIYPHHTREMHPDPDGLMHNPRGTWLTRFYRRQPRSWNSATHGKPVIHESVLQRTLGPDNSASTPYRPWILAEDYDVWRNGPD